MNKYITNIIIICIVIVLFFALSHFVGTAFGIAHVVLLAVAIYAIFLNVKTLKEK